MRELNPTSLMEKFMEADEIIENINMRLGEIHAEYEDLMIKRENLKQAKVNLRDQICGKVKLPAPARKTPAPVPRINVGQAPAQQAPAQQAPAQQAPAQQAPAQPAGRQTQPTYDFMNMADPHGRDQASKLTFHNNNYGGSVMDLPPLHQDGIAPVDGLTHEEILTASNAIREQKIKLGESAPPLPDIPMDEAASEVPQKALKQLKNITEQTLTI